MSYLPKKNVYAVHQDDKWVKICFAGSSFYGEQWYPVKIDRVWRDLDLKNITRELLGRINRAKI